MPVEWSVDERRPTLRARAYVAAMRLARDKSAFEGSDHTREVARRRQQDGDAPPTWPTRHLTRVDQLPGRGWRVRPRRREPSVRVLYLHGGGYVHPLTPDYWRLVRSLVAGGAEVVVPTYPLAPDHSVDEVVPWLLEVEATTRSGRPTVLMGDSAGGALALVLAGALRDTRHAPERVVALCPWLDAALAEPAVADLEPTDPMLAETGLRAAGRWWAGPRSPRDPRVSPAYGDLGGLPPVDVLIGDHDILRPAVDDLVRGIDAAEGVVRVREVTAMFHVWMTRSLPEGRRTRRQLARLVRGG